MKRPSKFDGEGKSPASDRLPSPSAGPPGSSRLIPFPRSAAALSAEGSEDAVVSSASASSTFVPLGDLTHAVVLRLAGGYPKIRGPARRRGGGGEPRRPYSTDPAEGDDAAG